MSAGGVMVSTAPVLGVGAGSIPSPALQSIRVQPIPFVAAKRILAKHHYLHSLPGGTMLAFGIFLYTRLLGAITYGAGPQNVYSLVDGAKPEDCLTLTRLWLSDELPKNSESRVMSYCIRSLKKYTHVKFLVTYADPSQGHVGIIYQATGWLYSGLSEAMPLFDIGDGILRHSRSLSHSYGSHSLEYFKGRGVDVKTVPQARKHRYVYFLDQSWRAKLNTAVLPYPKKEGRVRGISEYGNEGNSPLLPPTVLQREGK